MKCVDPDSGVCLVSDSNKLFPVSGKENVVEEHDYQVAIGESWGAKNGALGWPGQATASMEMSSLRRRHTGGGKCRPWVGNHVWTLKHCRGEG